MGPKERNLIQTFERCNFTAIKSYLEMNKYFKVIPFLKNLGFLG
jgi:hypothetical protein